MSSTHALTPESARSASRPISLLDGHVNRRGGRDTGRLRCPRLGHFEELDTVGVVRDDRHPIIANHETYRYLWEMWLGATDVRQ